MREAFPLLALAALLPAASALADGEAGPVPEVSPRPGVVAVYRGGEAEVPPRRGVRVLRGSSGMGAPPGPVAAPEAPVEAVGGDRLWLVDPATGGITACRLGATTQVGRDRIRCTRAGRAP